MSDLFYRGIQPRGLLRVWFALVTLFGLTGCQSARFYYQASRGQIEVLRRQVPVKPLLKDPQVDPTLKKQLIKIQELREFAGDFLKMPSSGYYEQYADLGRSHVVWNVFAAEEFSTEAKTWWYPLVGRLKYQGYFRKEMASQYADALRAQGLDVHVGPVSAYSTLGWFRDPILNTWAAFEETGLAELVFHELAHRRLFIRGDTDFNEAFATATARIGVRRWLQAHGRLQDLKHYEQQLKREESLSVAVRSTRTRLERIYAQSRIGTSTNAASASPPLDAIRKQKRELMEQLQRSFPQVFTEVPNNAWLAQIDTYERLVPGFERLHDRSGSDLELYFSAVKNLGRMPTAKRLEELEWLALLKPLE